MTELQRDPVSEKVGIQWSYLVCLLHDINRAIYLSIANRGESALGTSPNAALRTERDTLMSFSSHYPAQGLNPSFQCGNIIGLSFA